MNKNFLFPHTTRFCPREESNLNYSFRKAASYPLNDEGMDII